VTAIRRAPAARSGHSACVVRGREFERYARDALLPRLHDGFLARSSLVFKVTADNILHGVSTDSSAFSKDFFVWVFVQPLFVPHDTIAFDFGERVGGGSRCGRPRRCKTVH
jgi:hypothetical protein